MKMRKRAVTLIEMLIVVAILSFAFEGLFFGIVAIMKEGSFGAREMTARQQAGFATSLIFRDVKNSARALESYEEFKADSGTLILEADVRSSEKSPAVVIYNKDGNKLIRRMFAKDKKILNKTIIAENLNAFQCSVKEGLIKWSLEIAVNFKDEKRSFSAQSAAALKGGF